MIDNIHNGAIRWQIPDFLSVGNSKVCIFQRWLVKITTWTNFRENLGKVHGVQFSQWRHSMANVKIYKHFLFFIFAKVRPVRTKVIHTDRQTHTHTHTETDKPIAIGEILQFCLNICRCNVLVDFPKTDIPAQPY